MSAINGTTRTDNATTDSYQLPKNVAGATKYFGAIYTASAFAFGFEDKFFGFPYLVGGWLLEKSICYFREDLPTEAQTISRFSEALVNNYYSSGVDKGDRLYPSWM